MTTGILPFFYQAYTMNIINQLALHFEQVNKGGNWSNANLKTTLEDITWEQATKKIGTCNTILDLAYHIDYYVVGGIKVLQGGPLDIRDKYSFDHHIQSAEHWDAFKIQLLKNAAIYQKLLGNFDDIKLAEPYVLEKHGSYLRNILGLIEHHHYHLGQIVILKKVITVGYS